MQLALEAAGVEFTNGGQPGVRMKAGGDDPPPSELPKPKPARPRIPKPEQPVPDKPAPAPKYGPGKTPTPPAPKACLGNLASRFVDFQDPTKPSPKR
jgi:hypothetical protein